MDPRIGLIGRLKLVLNGYVYLGDRAEPDWKRPLPFYLFKCPVHGYVEGYPRGYEDTLVCPMCIEEIEEEWEKKAHVNALLLDSANEAIRAVET
ncbi:hypothetical protein A3K69_00540 [Candidatus Bathyarchaeota archaeon RBG_16_57_9]|nr:MAG: hypothetical protein A3K69_00540 [Candidatus Bathyarchaeota archaeon RBG_16_57_9]